MEAEWASRGHAAEAGRLRQEIRYLQEVSRAHRYDAEAAKLAWQTAQEHTTASARYAQSLESQLSRQARRAERRRMRAAKYRHEACQAVDRAEEERVARLQAEDKMQRRRLEAKALQADLACTGAFAAKLSAALDQQRAAAKDFELEALGWASLAANGAFASGRPGMTSERANAEAAEMTSDEDDVDGALTPEIMAIADRFPQRPCEIGVRAVLASRKSSAHTAVHMDLGSLESQVASLPGCLAASVALGRFTKRHSTHTGIAESFRRVQENVKTRSLTPQPPMVAMRSSRRSDIRGTCSADRRSTLGLFRLQSAR